GYMHERPPTTAERQRVIPTQLYGPLSQPYGFGDLLLAAGTPAIRFEQSVAPRCHAMGRGELWVKFDSPIEQPQRLAGGLLGPSWEDRNAPEPAVVCVEVLSRLAFSALNPCLIELRRDRAHNADSDLILEIKNVFKRTLKTVCP